ncbi:MAG: glycosyltransferase family 4 protein, partial [Chitinophagaceae bacterium]|nr:glycosyltransferase family 4 protein [Chitinophagaceae bacterium]
KLLVKEGHTVIVLMADENKENKDEVVTTDGFKIVLLRERYQALRSQYAPYFASGGLDAPGWIAAGIALKDWLMYNHNSYDIDIIEVSDYGGMGIFLKTANLPPVVVTGHGTFTQLSRYNIVKEDDQTAIIRRLELLSLQKADAVIAHSPSNQADLAQLSGRVIEFATAPWMSETKTITSTSHNMIFAAGGLQKVKGAITLAAAINSCANQSEQVEACWAGGDTFTAPGATRMSEYLEKEFPAIWNKQFTWLKDLSHAELITKMELAEMVVIPSEWETLSYVALEAAAMGKPIILTATTGIVYLFEQEETALIVPANDPQQLALAILRLQNDVSLRERLGSNAAAMINRVFIEKKITDERINLYQRTIREKQPTTEANRDELQFLKKYITPGRKYFYTFKAMLKKILRNH